MQMAGDHIGIPLHNQRLFALLHGCLGQGETVEDTTFVKEGGLRRVEIFGTVHGLTTLKSPTSKCDGAPQAIVNGEHKTVAEAVVGATLGLPDYRQTALYQDLMRKPLFLHRLIQG